VKNPTVEGLQAAIDEGKTAGVALDILNSALKALSEERRRVASRNEQKIVKQVCPTCHASFKSLEEVRAHWQAVHGPATSAATTAQAASTEKQSAAVSADADKKKVKQICPTCYASFASLEAVRAHWLEVHGSASNTSGSSSNVGYPAEAARAGTAPADAQSCPPCKGGKQMKQICPTCRESFTSLEAVRAHWLEVHGQGAASADGQSATARAAGKSETQNEAVHVVACDDEGKPTVMRKVEPETGVAKTIVLNSDGTQRVFGESTVLSMASSDEAKVNEWLACMTDIQLRGLVHEVTERVVEGSTRYHSRRNDLQKVSDRLNLQYFGLSAEASERDVDNVYRKFARSMHPDKNGGTEEAKEKFQNMKTRYEALKKQFAEAQQSCTGQGCSSGSADEDRTSASTREADAASAENGSDETKKPKERQEAYEEDEEQAAAADKENEKLDCDYSNRASLEEMAWKMLRQMKSIKQNMDILEGELQRFSTASN